MERTASSLGLSDRESQIVAGLFAGLNEAEISRQLAISSHTVHSHIKRLYRKLGVTDRQTLLIRIFQSYLEVHDQHRRS